MNLKNSIACILLEIIPIKTHTKFISAYNLEIIKSWHLKNLKVQYFSKIRKSSGDMGLLVFGKIKKNIYILGSN